MSNFAVKLNVNGSIREVAVDSTTLLIEAIRSAFGLTGTKLGCASGDCGACTVVMNGRVASSCLVYAMECDGTEVQTVEGIAQTPIGRMIVEELIATDGSQCGFCTPGIVVTATVLLDLGDRDHLTDSDINTALAGNLCRCTGYFPIKQAIRRVAARLISGQST
ncbi:(2Fe-2S)-binding protein [Tardiphaga sp. 866_E4_N2_1]|uniref:(2Fe-2S)-binding protein n=1 Tax=unclassified Tardiphaga TaxID=2631404 RepID=UPI003F22C2D8